MSNTERAAIMLAEKMKRTTFLDEDEAFIHAEALKALQYKIKKEKTKREEKHRERVKLHEVSVAAAGVIE